MALSDILCIRDLEKAATGILGRTILEYFNDGAEDGIALAENISAFDKYKIRPRVLRDVSKIDTTKQAFGSTMSFPLIVAPSAMQRMAHHDGEKATARAAAKTGVFMGVSTFATTTLEDVKQAGDEVRSNVFLLQLYIFKNRKATEMLVRRAERAGYKAVLLTCDTPVLGNRYNMTRNDFKLPSHLNLPNFGKEHVDPLIPELSKSKVPAEEVVEEVPPNVNDDSLTWDETLLWLRSITNMDIWLKGVTTAEDIEIAVKSPAKISGVIVSNHGGRQLEYALGTLDSLPECVEVAKAHNKDFQIWIDGGIRKGSDMFKALALGADGVLIGRVPLWGLAVGGEEGVTKAINILKSEFEHTMVLAGCQSLADIKSSALARRIEGGFYARL